MIQAHQQASDAPQPSGLAGRIDFQSHALDSTMRHLLGDQIVEKARDLRASQGFQQLIASRFYQGDAPADNLARAIRQDRQIGKQLQQALSEGVESQPGLPEELVDFVHSAERIPDFIDRQKVTEGGRVFRSKLDLFGLITYGLPVGIYLQGMVPSISMALLFTNRPTREPAPIQAVLARKESKRRGFVRVLETFRWFNTVAEEGAGDLYSKEFAENCRIRLVHAHIRAAIEGHKDDWKYQPPFGWDHDMLGVPMSASDGSIVVSTIVVTLLAMRRHLHKSISEEEMDALNHWVNYVSYLQGVPEELLCDTYEGTATQLTAFMMSMDTSACHEQLACFMEELQDLGLGKGLFRNFKPLALWLDGLGAAALDKVFDDPLKAHFRIQRASMVARVNYALFCSLIGLVNRAARVSARINDALDRQTIRLWRTVMPEAERLLSRMHGRVVG